MRGGGNVSWVGWVGAEFQHGAITIKKSAMQRRMIWHDMLQVPSGDVIEGMMGGIN